MRDNYVKWKGKDEGEINLGEFIRISDPTLSVNSVMGLTVKTRPGKYSVKTLRDTKNNIMAVRLNHEKALIDKQAMVLKKISDISCISGMITTCNVPTFRNKVVIEKTIASIDDLFLDSVAIKENPVEYAYQQRMNTTSNDILLDKSECIFFPGGSCDVLEVVGAMEKSTVRFVAFQSFLILCDVRGHGQTTLDLHRKYFLMNLRKEYENNN